MKNNYVYCLILLLFALPQTVSAEYSEETEAWLDKLDASLARYDQIQQHKLTRVKELKSALPASKREGRYYEQLYSIYLEYKVFSYDSAHHYAELCYQEAQRMNSAEKILEAKQAVIFTLITAGILTEAEGLMKTIDRASIPANQLEAYYDLNCNLWRNMADYIHEEPYYTKYISRCNAYNDSIIALHPVGTIEWWAYTGMLQMRTGQYAKAEKSLLRVLSMCEGDLRMEATTSAELAWAYFNLNDEDKAIQLFARSAIADNESATREITALYHLARFIYKRGDYERASIYVHQALEEVNFFNTRLRKVEINDILPIIEQDRYDALSSQRNWLIAASVLFFVLLFIMVGAYVVIRKNNQKLKEARQTIAENLEQLQVANSHLQEDGKIKNAYIGRSFYTNAEYITKLEKLFKSIDRKLVAKQYEDLRMMVRLSTLNSERDNMFEAFDHTFLSLFPDYVVRYNELFDEEDRKEPEKENSLTTEMRIYALVRLGVSDSESIAKFLNFSVHTVNTYKTRIRNRSRYKGDQFESLIMQI